MNFFNERKKITQEYKALGFNNTKVISAINSIYRENFVIDKYKDFSYIDIELPILNKQKMLSPLIELRLLTESIKKSNNKVLLIGTGSGFFTALFSNIYKFAITVENNIEIFKFAQQNLKNNNIKNVSIFNGDGLNVDKRWCEKKYDLIIITFPILFLPKYYESLINFNGRIIAMKRNDRMMVLKKFEFTKHNNQLLEKNIFEVGLNNTDHEPFFTF